MSCYNCGIHVNQYYAEENGYQLVKCVGCGLLYVANPPTLDDINRGHTQGLHRGEKTLDVTGWYDTRASKRYLPILRDLFIEGPGNNSSWLDVGCGHGEFLEALKKFSGGSVRVFGSEPNIFKQESARARGLDVSFIDLDTHREKYDYISLLNVYSHLPNPPEFLRKLYNLLEKKGELIIETGDTANFSPQDHYRPFFLPDHLSFASKEIVENILCRAGFEILVIKKYPFRLSFNKEFIKMFLPGYRSQFCGLGKWQEADMFVRARKL